MCAGIDLRVPMPSYKSEIQRARRTEEQLKKIEKINHNFSLPENKLKCNVYGWKKRMNKQLAARNVSNGDFLNFPVFHLPDRKFCAIMSKIEDPEDTLEVINLTNQLGIFTISQQKITKSASKKSN